MKAHRVLLTGVGLLAMFAVQGDDSDPYSQFRGGNDYNEALEVPWVESETQVVNPPVQGNLVRVELSSLPVGMELSIDSENFSVGDDYVSRTWLVVDSRAGGYNAAFEGLRCSTGEYKVYAYHTPDRQQPLRRVEFPRWRQARDRSYRKELMENVLCAGPRPEPISRILDNIRRDASSYQPPY